ncbi:hypothetical protein OESDEN_00345 [Oesophagostomum dentatum]|uniref:Uncharacterized protein n=1 Tax=Oesophagostomum dentatum TaxID=61180 RepID=A0A0B1TQ81_OESDE|nr:hypothetical protein OESDEN_00345 [Oesophagostomum dentatum]
MKKATVSLINFRCQQKERERVVSTRREASLYLPPFRHVALKKELDEKKTELEDLLTEGKRLSDHSGKQAREIRRLKNELTELEKVKQERKRLKDEKLRAEETIELQKEEITSLKGMI